jgi:hypothetical protein
MRISQQPGASLLLISVAVLEMLWLQKNALPPVNRFRKIHIEMRPKLSELTPQGASNKSVNCPGTKVIPGQLDKFCRFILVKRVVGIASDNTVNEPNSGIVGPIHMPLATPNPTSPSDIITQDKSVWIGVYSTKIFGAVGNAISVSEILGKGIGTGPSKQTSGNPIFITIILFANIATVPFFSIFFLHR